MHYQISTIGVEIGLINCETLVIPMVYHHQLDVHHK